MEPPSLTAAVRRELLARPGVTEGEHRFGGTVFRVGNHEIGHLHGETVADLPFPEPIRGDLVASGRVAPDRATPESAWVSRSVEGPEDVAEIVELFRISYEHAAAEAARDRDRAEREPPAPQAPERPRARWRLRRRGGRS